MTGHIQRGFKTCSRPPVSMLPLRQALQPYMNIKILKYKIAKKKKKYKKNLKKKRKIHLMNYELRIFLKIFFLNTLRLSVSLMNLGKELIFVPRNAKALCPVASLHLGNERSLFCVVPLCLISERC